MFNQLNKIPKPLIFILNQIFEIEQKVNKIAEPHSIQRNIDKLKEYFENSIDENGLGLIYENPINQPYNETRTDCEASIAGNSTENLIITEVIKPIIRIISRKEKNHTSIVQKAIVIVQSKKMEEN
jgi:hypothetical protein